MKTSSISQIKKELQTLPHGKVLELCMHLAKYKKENKELLSYLLFEADDEPSYVKEVKEMIQVQFEEMNPGNSYLAKKSIRKILRLTNKYIKYSGSKQTEVELLIFFCKTMRKCGIRLDTSTALSNLYQAQVLKINKSLSTLHEDLQHDYRDEVASIVIADQDLSKSKNWFW